MAQEPYQVQITYTFSVPPEDVPLLIQTARRQWNDLNGLDRDADEADREIGTVAEAIDELFSAMGLPPVVSGYEVVGKDMGNLSNIPSCPDCKSELVEAYDDGGSKKKCQCSDCSLLFEVDKT